MNPTNGYPHLPHGELQYASTTPPSQQQVAKDPGLHQRTYQACIPCRRRKVRCDLGSVDNPHDPPCVRCRRESKECYFSATRRKKKAGGRDGSVSEGDDETVYEIKSGKKRVRLTSIAPEGDGAFDDPDDEPRTPGGSLGRLQPLRRPQPQRPVQYGEEEQKASDQTAAILQAAELHSGHDALKLLSSAATMRDRLGSKELLQRPNFSGLSPSSLPPATSPILGRAGPNSYNNVGPTVTSGVDQMWTSNAEPGLQRDSTNASTPMDIASYNSALKAWSRHRFVRAGWFTAKEAIDYISYFYQYLSLLTPVAIPDFRSYNTHESLLTQEPMLTVTLLLISSRHMKLEGPGAVSRPYAIHDKLWKYLSGMINRVVWGQEQFGGGFCGAGAEPGSDVNPLTRKGLRTLGTVESLVLLTEWHPRAMHFPPDEDDEELMLPDQPITTPGYADENDAPKGIGGQRMDAWLEPCWRSDRMCWMLLGMAMSLAFEIGVFDQSDWQRHARSTDGQPLSAAELQTYDRRRGTVRDLLLVYVTQTSGRLGLTSMLPGNYSKPEDSDTFKREQHSGMDETVLHFWLRMAAIMREGNQTIFPNKAFTRDLIKNGNYMGALDRLREPLLTWRQDFDANHSIPQYMRHILEIEYEYCRVYLNALALQAVAERCANEHPMAQVLDPPLEIARSTITTNGVRTDVAIDPQTLAKWLGGDQKYMQAVGDGARNLLKTVVEGLYPKGFLRHAPVRTYFRIISVAIMLLKSFSLGASESDMAESLILVDRTIEALKTCIVDDVHVASRFAELLNILTQSLKPRLVRISAEGRSGRSRRVSHPGSPVPGFASVNPAFQRLHTQQAQQQHAMTGAMHNQQQWNVNGYASTNTLGGATSSDPLYGIAVDHYDPSGNSYSVMPPPNFGQMRSPTTGNLATNGPAGAGGYNPYAGSSNFGSDQPQDWFALPLDNLINMQPGAEVNQTMYGPQIGDQDMLEMLLYDIPGQQNTNGYS